MPPQIQSIAENYLRDPEQLEIEAATASAIPLTNVFGWSVVPQKILP